MQVSYPFQDAGAPKVTTPRLSHRGCPRTNDQDAKCLYSLCPFSVADVSRNLDLSIALCRIPMSGPFIRFDRVTGD
jgi:hypothetical protein